MGQTMSGFVATDVQFSGKCQPTRIWEPQVLAGMDFFVHAATAEWPSANQVGKHRMITAIRKIEKQQTIRKWSPKAKVIDLSRS